MARITTPESRETTEIGPGVEVGHIGYGEQLHATHVTIEPDGLADTHSHPHEQISYVVSGEIVMTVDGEDHRLGPGEAVYIPGDTEHAATNETEETATVVDMFSPRREDLLE